MLATAWIDVRSEVDAAGSGKLSVPRGAASRPIRQAHRGGGSRAARVPWTRTRWPPHYYTRGVRLTLMTARYDTARIVLVCIHPHSILAVQVKYQDLVLAPFISSCSRCIT